LIQRATELKSPFGSFGAGGTEDFSKEESASN
jgi:hypothetical protein